VRSSEISDAAIAAGEMGKNPAPGRVSQRGERSIQCSRRIFNHMVKYQSEDRLRKELFWPASFRTADLQNPADRARGCQDRPCRKGQERAKEERFNYELPLIFARKKIASESQNRSAGSQRSRFFCFPNGSLNYDYAHDSA